MYKEVKGSEAMGYLSTRPNMIITTRHASGIVNAGVFGSWTNLSPKEIGMAVSTSSHAYANILRKAAKVICHKKPLLIIKGPYQYTPLP